MTHSQIIEMQTDNKATDWENVEVVLEVRLIDIKAYAQYIQITDVCLLCFGSSPKEKPFAWFQRNPSGDSRGLNIEGLRQVW